MPAPKILRIITSLVCCQAPINKALMMIRNNRYIPVQAIQVISSFPFCSLAAVMLPAKHAAHAMIIPITSVLPSGRIPFPIKNAATMPKTIVAINAIAAPERILFHIGCVCSMFPSPFALAYSHTCPAITKGHKKCARDFSGAFLITSWSRRERTRWKRSPSGQTQYEHGLRWFPEQSCRP